MQEVSPSASEARQLQLARENVSNYLPPSLDKGKFRNAPFVAKDLRTCKYVFLRDDRFAKPPLAPRYLGPFQVLQRHWDNNTFVIRMGGRQEVVSLSRLKASATDS